MFTYTYTYIISSNLVYNFIFLYISLMSFYVDVLTFYSFLTHPSLGSALAMPLKLLILRPPMTSGVLSVCSATTGMDELRPVAPFLFVLHVPGTLGLTYFLCTLCYFPPSAFPIFCTSSLAYSSSQFPPCSFPQLTPSLLLSLNTNVTGKVALDYCSSALKYSSGM